MTTQKQSKNRAGRTQKIATENRKPHVESQQLATDLAAAVDDINGERGHKNYGAAGERKLPIARRIVGFPHRRGREILNRSILLFDDGGEEVEQALGHGLDVIAEIFQQNADATQVSCHSDS